MDSDQYRNQADPFGEPEINPEGFFSDLTNNNACSVRVAVRVRPLVGRELYENAKICVDVDQQTNKIQIGEKNFQFDRVFPSNCPQRDLFEACGRNLVLGCFAGYNATILAYGQTGSGKTHTMGTGSTNGILDDQVGIVPRVFRFIFEELDRRRQLSTFSEFTIKVSFLELYNEELHDLLDPVMVGGQAQKSTKELLIKEKNGNIYVQGLKEEPVSSTEECLMLLNKGISHRTTSATLMNEGSSRSHAIFTIAIEQRIVKEFEIPAEVEGADASKQAPAAGQQEELISAKFHFVDLAGSERIKRTGATGQLLKEGISINKGLLCLGNVIAALTEESKKQQHIPYRDSKLTRILQDSLGGNSRTTMIACVSPAESNYEETLNSIKYASRARNIKNKPVVNRDPNSMLIDSLRTQISSLQGEIKDPGKAVAVSSDQVANGGSINFGELREVKIQLSKKEKELKDLRDQLVQLAQKNADKDQAINQLQNERDNLRLKNEIMEECLQKNNIAFEAPSGQGQSQSLIEEYKTKLAQMQREIERKDKEIQEKTKMTGQLQVQMQRDEEVSRKYLEENQRLKRQLKKMEEMQAQSPTRGHQNAQTSLRIKPQPTKQGQVSATGQLNDVAIPDLNEKFISNLSTQLESMFQAGPEDESFLVNKADKADESPSEVASTIQLQSQDSLNEEEGNSSETQLMQEKQKILELVKQQTAQMQKDMMELMKTKYEQRIVEIEKEKQRIDSERQDTLKRAGAAGSVDQKQQQAIEQQYKQKMEDLNKQLAQFKEKEKKQEVVSKQINVQIQKIKNLEEDLTKMKKKEEDLQKQRQNESQKYSQVKQTLSKELSLAKKLAQDREQTLQKLKLDLKKVDELAQKKMSELKGFQRKVAEERQRREKEKQEEYESKGIDIERIKIWITENTNRMLEHRELTELMDLQLEKKNEIEEEMLQEGEKLAQLMMEKDRMEVEMEQAGETADESDEGRILEIEELHYQKTMEVDQVTEHLDSLDETLSFVNNKINELTEQIASLDIDNIEPIKFSGLKSVDAAKVTLQTFFGVLLDINIYKRDLEVKCIESDEAILNLNDQIRLLNLKMEEMSQNSLLGASSSDAKGGIPNPNKEKAIKNLVETLDGYVDYQDVKNLHLTPNEQNSLTKLSLSKIVSNLKQKLKEEETKNQNLSHKLESALNDKEQLKLKLDNLKKKFKDDKLLAARPAKEATADNNARAPAQSEDVRAKDQPEKKFSSLANARDRRKQGGQPSIGGGSSAAQSTNGSNNPNGKNSNPDSLNQTQNSDSGDNIDITTITKTSGGTSNLHLKYKAKMQNQRPGSSMDANADANAFQSRSGRNGLTGQNSQKSFNMGMGGGTAMNQRRFNAQTSFGSSQEAMQKNSPQKNESGNLMFNQPDTSFLKKQLMPITEYNGPQKKPVANFNDRRNRHKMEKTDVTDGSAPEQDKVLEIDSIKELAQNIGQSNARERRQSRMREFSKKRNKLQSSNLFQSVQNTQQNNDRNDVQVIAQTMGAQKQSGKNLNLASNDFEYNTGAMESMLSPSKGLRNKWNLEELTQVESHGQNLVGCDYANNKLIMVFEDFSIREISLITLEELSNFHVFMVNKLPPTGERCVDFCIDRDLNAIAIASDRTVYVFDYSDGYKLITKIEVGNIAQVLFCNFFVIVLVHDDNVSYVVSYQIGEDEPIELYSYAIQTGGYPTFIKTDNQNIFFTSGIKIGRLEMPELQPTFIVESEHTDIIINFSVSQYAIITTSRDSTIRCHHIDTGEQCQETLQEMECDHLETEGDFVLTRCGGGQALLIFKYSPFSTELDLIDEIPIQPLTEFEVLDFKMRGKISAKFGKVSYNLVLMTTCVREGFMISALKHKPLSEY